MVKFGFNMVSFLLAPGARKWYVVGACLPPNRNSIVHHMYQVLKTAPKGGRGNTVGRP